MKSDFLSILAALLILLPGTAAIAQAEDPHAYLEEIEGARALAFARAENARSLSVLQGDPRYPQLYADALAIATSADRIPTVTFANDGSLRNFWQDATHVRGIWRTTDLAIYAKGAPAWKTILDLDA